MAPSRAHIARALALAGIVVLLSAGRSAAEAIPPKVLAALESRSVRVRVTAVVAVSKSQDPNARVILEGMLKDEAEPVRAAALEGLQRVLDPASLPAVKALEKDKSALVRRLAGETTALLEARRRALARAKQKQPGAPATGKAVVVELGPARDMSSRAPAGALDSLRGLVSYAVRTDRRRAVQVESAGVDKGYGLMLAIRSIEPFSQGAANGLEVRCELTVVELPSKALRLSLAATAAAGVEGALDPETEKSLVADAVQACAPALGKDFSDWLAKR